MMIRIIILAGEEEDGNCPLSVLCPEYLVFVLCVFLKNVQHPADLICSTHLSVCLLSVSRPFIIYLRVLVGMLSVYCLVSIVY